MTETIDAIRIAKIKNTICQYFGSNCNMAIAVATAESGLNPTAKGWNCHYPHPTEPGKTVSKACKPQDRGNAWSVDCGVFQINFKGLECPAEALTLEWNVDRAYNWKFKNCQCWGAWSAWKDNKHLPFLKEN